MTTNSLLKRAALFFALSVVLPVGALATIDPTRGTVRLSGGCGVVAHSLALTHGRERAQDGAAISCGDAGRGRLAATGVTIGAAQ